MNDAEKLEAIRGIAYSMANCTESADARSKDTRDQFALILKAELTFRRILDLCGKPLPQGRKAGK